MKIQIKTKEFFLDDPRLNMTVWGRLFVRAVSVTAYIILVIGTGMGLLADIGWVRWTAAFFALVLADRVLHRHEGDTPIPDLLAREKANVAGSVLPGLAPTVEHALDASILGHRDLALNLIHGLMEHKDVLEGLRRLDVDPKEVLRRAEEFLQKEEAVQDISRAERMDLLKNLLVQAIAIAAENGHRFVSAVDLFSALHGAGSPLTDRIFSSFSIDPGDLERAMLFSSARRHSTVLGRIPEAVSGFAFESDRSPRHRVVNRAWTSRATPVLDRFATDFSESARNRQIGFLIGHDAEYEHLVTVLAREENPNAILIGEEGAGRETVIAHLAYQIGKDRVPPALFDKRLVSLDISRLVASASADELQERLQRIVEEIIISGNIILLIPDIHNLVKTSGSSFLSAADALMPILKDNAFPVLGTTYPREHRDLIEPRSDFNAIFENIEIGEISSEDAERVLVYYALVLERQLKIRVTFGAVKEAVRLGKQYFKTKMLPGSAIDLLTSAGRLCVERGGKVTDHETVIAAAEARTNVPLHAANAEERSELLNLEAVIHERVIGQDEAVKAVADALRQYRSGMTRKNGPIASFLFVGPTGVGKTELAKAVAAIHFGSEKSMLRFDMSEYKDTASVQKLIGSPNLPGTLTDAIEARPFGLVLLDELEKAHPEILDLFLQVLDDGRLTDGEGRTADFTNAIIIATSNAHSDLINEALNKGQSMADIGEYLKRRLTDVMKPELLNRFSKIIIFHDLSPADTEKIASLELKKLSNDLMDQGMTVSFSPEAVKLLSKKGYDPQFGARPLRRAIDELVKAPMAEFILRENPQRGAEVRVGAEGDRFVFEAKS